MALSLVRVRGECLDAAPLHYQCSEETWQQGVDRLWSVPDSAALSWTHSCNTEKPAASPKPREGTAHAFTLWSAGITTELRGLTASQSRPADIFTTAAVPGRSAAQDVCVASSNAAAARGDAAQAAFERKLSLNCAIRAFTTVSLVWTADGTTAPGCHSDASVCSRYRRNHFIAGGSLRSKSLSYDGGQPWLARFCRILQRERNGSSLASLTEPCTTPDDDDDIVSLASNAHESV